MRIHFKRLVDREKWNFSQFWEHEPLINWNMLKKCILLLILASLISLFGIIWDSFVLLNPFTWQWVNLPLVRSKLWTNVIMLFVFLSLIMPCFIYKDKSWVQEIIPILSVQVVTVLLCHIGYLIGSFSPATMVAYVSVVGVGLVLFDRKMIYCALVPATIALLFCNFLSMYGVLQYAPIFKLEVLNQAQMHPFWVGSMFFFLLPILIACLLLFESLLKQWRIRETAIQVLSLLDPLTNVMNRRSISNHLERLHQQPNQLYSIVLLDLDHFKNINDQFGHSMGDQVLIQVTRCLANNVRDQDVIGRFGGEEFVMLVPNASIDRAQQLAEKVRTSIERLRLVRRHDKLEIAPFTISVGVALRQREESIEPLFDRADKALYRAKHNGRNCVVASS